MARKRNRQKNIFFPQSSDSPIVSLMSCSSMATGEKCSHEEEPEGKKNPNLVICGNHVRKNGSIDTGFGEQIAYGQSMNGAFLEEMPHLMDKTGKPSEINTEGRFGGLISSYMADLRHIWLSLISISKAAMEWVEHTVNVNLRTPMLFLAKRTRDWVERKKSYFVILTNLILKVWVSIRTSIAHTFPVVRSRLTLCGNVALLVFLVWLDFAARGAVSFLCMGTVSFCSVIWFGVFSLIAMAGALKFFAAMVFVAFVGVFVGLLPAFLVFILSSAIFMWIYGSFWTTTIVIFLTGVGIFVKFGRSALLMMTTYSFYCAWTYTGYTGIFFSMNLSFLSSDVLVYFLMSNADDRRSNAASDYGQPGSSPNGQTPIQNTAGEWVDRGPGIPSTSGSGTDFETTSEVEVERLLNCSDHYSVLGFTPFENVDLSILKREYRRKAMLVHPDKNMGNERAAEAFKKLQNAYEILHDVLKRRTYDDDLRRQDLLNCFQKFQNLCKKREGTFTSGYSLFRGGIDSSGKSKRTSCKKCDGFHHWIYTNKHISRARWCQDCKDFHPSKHGDGWVEQCPHPLFFGLVHKMDTPRTYVCAESVIYDATEWYICQGMKCAVNTHKPSFHVKSRARSAGEKSGIEDGEDVMMEEILTETSMFETPQRATPSATASPKEGKSYQKRRKGRGGRHC